MSDYFERVEAHLLDAVEREARRRGGRSGQAAGALRRGDSQASGGARRGALRVRAVRAAACG